MPDRQRYTGERTSGAGRTRYTGKDEKPTKKNGGGGILGAIKRLPGDFGRGAENTLLQAPAAVMEIHHALAAADPSNPTHFGHSDPRKLKALGHAYVKQTEDTVKHPLRDPFATTLAVIPVVGAAARVGLGANAATRAVKAGEGAGKAAKVAVRPPVGTREIKVGGATAKGHYSRASGARVAQKASDAALKKAAAKSKRAENMLHRRGAKFNERTLRVQTSKARVPGSRAAVLGKKLSPAEHRALRLVAEEVPVARRLGAQEMRAARAKHPAETARHAERIGLTKGALEFLDEGPGGKPVFKPGATKLKAVYEAVRAASADRGEMLKNLGLMSEEAQQAAKLKAAQHAAGATAATRTPALAEKRLATLERQHTKAIDEMASAMFGPIERRDVNQRTRNNKRATRQASGMGGAAAWKSVTKPTMKNERRNLVEQKVEDAIARNPEHPTLKRWAERVQEIDTLRSELNRDFGEPKLSGPIGAEDVTVSKEAPFVGNPVERTRYLGAPKVSSGKTFGHTRRPASLKKSTGGSVEHALERNDVTNIVAERHAEAVRLSDIHRRVALIKDAGTKTPGRKDDVWVWTDKTVSQEKIPAAARKFLDNPEGLERMPVEKQQKIIDQIREAATERRNWHVDEDARAEFEQLAKQGKGVFVPRRFTGDIGKRNPNLDSVPGVGAIDAINNAQKMALVYLKVNYPLVQAMSNALMNVIQQGFAYPYNITRAAKVYHGDPEVQAVAKDIMGQGAVVQAAFHGETKLSHLSQKVANAMSSKVDEPARLVAFYHEARVAGYGSPEKFRGLIFDDANADKLAEVAQRAKEAIVDYGELSPTEKVIVRRVLFVYPWQKGGTMYAAHFFRDHPVQAAALGMLGQRGNKINDGKLGPVPSYMKGSFDVGGKLVNPTGVNFFSTPAQIGRAVTHPTSGGLQSFLAPATGAAVAATTGRDDIGRPLSKNPVAAARQTFVEGVPAAAAARSLVGDRKGPQFNVARALVGSKTISKSFPNPNDALWRFLVGGLYPRQYDKGALNRNAALEKTRR